MAPKKSLNKKRPAVKPQKVTFTAEQLFEAAQEALAYDDYEKAGLCFQHCVRQAPENTDYLDAYGSFLAEVGQEKEAIKVLRRSIELSPEKGHEKYMYLGQLLEDEAAMQMVQKGIDVLRQAIHTADTTAVDEGEQPGPSSSEGSGGGAVGSVDVGQMKAQLASAICSLAEMVMASTGEVDSVAQEVEGLLQQAQEADSTSPEPLQVLASLRYESGRADEALALMKQSLALWFHPEAGSSDDEDEDIGDDEDEDIVLELGEQAGDMEGDEEMCDARKASGQQSEMSGREESKFEPSYEFRIEAAKLMLELDESTDTSLLILEDLIMENDSVPEVWHLLGYAYYGSMMLDEAEEAVMKGLEIAAKMGVDEDLTVVLEDLKSAIAEAKSGEAKEGGPDQQKEQCG